MKWAIAIAGILLLVFLFLFDPATSGLFPPCPFLYVTDLKCPGCGALRATHQLSHFDILAAFALNPLLVLSIPYIAGYYILRLLGRRYQALRKWELRLYYGKVPFIVAFVIVSYWLLRNIFDF